MTKTSCQLVMTITCAAIASAIKMDSLHDQSDTSSQCSSVGTGISQKNKTQAEGCCCFVVGTIPVEAEFVKEQNVDCQMACSQTGRAALVSVEKEDDCKSEKIDARQCGNDIFRKCCCMRNMQEIIHERDVMLQGNLERSIYVSASPPQDCSAICKSAYGEYGVAVAQISSQESCTTKQPKTFGKSLIFDFDCTLSSHHLYMTSHRRFAGTEWDTTAIKSGQFSTGYDIGERWQHQDYARWIMGGSENIERLRNWLMAKRQLGYSLEICTKSEVERVSQVLKHVELRDLFDIIHGATNDDTDRLHQPLRKVLFYDDSFQWRPRGETKASWIKLRRKDVVAFIDDTTRNYDDLSNYNQMFKVYYGLTENGPGITLEGEFDKLDRFLDEAEQMSKGVESYRKFGNFA
eukprot:TRINITY_DN23044_c0_g3_i1.p1 TRINITY_DN23044_c0_g3~~TRINITY_DN23044_c0_g3_i1.p1  ORF type:complete len:405 (+),score=33.83 TRINITY_DN23044_c0_g3_i1:85-1299(+)